MVLTEQGRKKIFRALQVVSRESLMRQNFSDELLRPAKNLIRRLKTYPIRWIRPDDPIRQILLSTLHSSQNNKQAKAKAKQIDNQNKNN